MERWKGGRKPLLLMRKHLKPGGLADLAGLAPGGVVLLPAAQRFSELEVTVGQVREYEANGAGGQAYLWFALLVLRNIKKLSPVYGAVGGTSAIMGLLTYALLAEWARSS